MQETRIQLLGQEDPLEKGMETHSSILAWKIPWTEELAGYSPWGHKESDWATFTLLFRLLQWLSSKESACNAGGTGDMG